MRSGRPLTTMWGFPLNKETELAASPVGSRRTQLMWFVFSSRLHTQLSTQSLLYLPPDSIWSLAVASFINIERAIRRIFRIIVSQCTRDQWKYWKTIPQHNKNQSPKDGFRFRVYRTVGALNPNLLRAQDVSAGGTLAVGTSCQMFKLPWAD